MRAQDIACTQVDWVGHSMGGLLPRVYFRTGFYRRPDNFGAGDLHKLVTLNTPHWGSPMANALVGIRDQSIFGGALESVMDAIGMPISNGAIDDLAEGSGALAGIGTTAIPSHTIAGKGGSEILGLADIGFSAASNLAPPPWRTVFAVLDLITTASTVFLYRNQPHDLIVLVPSQHGGVTGAATDLLCGFGTIHTSVTAHGPAANLATSLLQDVTDGPRFRTIPPPLLSVPLLAPIIDPPMSSGSLALASPATSSGANPGDTISISATGADGFDPFKVVFFFPDGNTVVDTTPPFEATFTIPSESAGTIEIIAGACDAMGEVAFSAPLPISISLPTLLTMSAIPTEIFLVEPLEDIALQIEGTFDDGISRDITGADTGTTYLSSNPLVAVVSPEGNVQAVSPGVATISAMNGTIQTSVGVFVDFQSVVQYGSGLPGSGDIVPKIDTQNEDASLGNPNFVVRFSETRGGARGFIVVSRGADQFDFGTGSILVSLAEVQSTLIVQASGAEGMPGVGVVNCPVPVPADPALLGETVYLQAFFEDSGTPFGWSTTNGIRVMVVP